MRRNYTGMEIQIQICLCPTNDCFVVWNQFRRENMNLSKFNLHSSLLLQCSFTRNEKLFSIFPPRSRSHQHNRLRYGAQKFVPFSLWGNLIANNWLRCAIIKNTFYIFHYLLASLMLRLRVSIVPTFLLRSPTSLFGICSALTQNLAEVHMRYACDEHERRRE